MRPASEGRRQARSRRGGGRSRAGRGGASGPFGALEGWRVGRVQLLPYPARLPPHGHSQIRHPRRTCA